MTIIYILQLIDNKIYIGKTNNLKSTLEQHFTFKGSIWTTKYKPIKVIEVIENADIYDEDKIVQQYMDLYGIHNVRGGSFTQTILDKPTINLLEKMKIRRLGLCHKCGITGHFATNCNINNHDKKYFCIYCNLGFIYLNNKTSHENYCSKKNSNNIPVINNIDNDTYIQINNIDELDSFITINNIDNNFCNKILEIFNLIKINTTYCILYIFTNTNYIDI